MAKEVKKRCAELVEKSKGIVREAFEKFKPLEMAITWTGGKDSTWRIILNFQKL